MTRVLRHRRLTAWIASLAILLGVLMPAIAQAITRPDDTGRWEQICTAAGMVWINLDLQPESGEGPAPAAGNGQCPFCLPFGGQFLAPVLGEQLAMPSLDGHGVYQSWPDPALRKHRFLLHALARAPPQIS